MQQEFKQTRLISDEDMGETMWEEENQVNGTDTAPSGRILTLPPESCACEVSERRVYAAAAQFVTLLPPEGGVPGGNVKMRLTRP